MTRPIGLPQDNHLRRELAVEGTPQQNWIAASDGKRGLAVVAPGQYESAVLDLHSRPLCVTLFRAFSRAYLTQGNEGGQIQGTHRFRMALLPVAEIQAASLYQVAQSLASGMRSAQFEPREEPVAESHIPVNASLLELRGGAVLSAFYRTNREILLRVYNPSSTARTIQVNSLLPIGAWQRVNLDGQPEESEQKVNNKPFEFLLAPWKIQTVRISLIAPSGFQEVKTFKQTRNEHNRSSIKNQALSA